MAQRAACPSELKAREDRRDRRPAAVDHLPKTLMFLPPFVRCSLRPESRPVAK